MRDTSAAEWCMIKEVVMESILQLQWHGMALDNPAYVCHVPPSIRLLQWASFLLSRDMPPVPLYQDSPLGSIETFPVASSSLPTMQPACTSCRCSFGHSSAGRQTWHRTCKSRQQLPCCLYLVETALQASPSKRSCKRPCLQVLVARSQEI